MTKEFKHIPEKKNNMFTINMNIRLAEYMDFIACTTFELISSEAVNKTTDSMDVLCSSVVYIYNTYDITI